jgi:hypothetical protein
MLFPPFSRAAEGDNAMLEADDLVGAWKLVRWEISYSDDRPVSLPFGDDAEGMIMYTPNGYMSAVLHPAKRGPVSTQYVLQAPAEEKADLFASFMFYGGPYRIEGEDVIHSVEHALNPDLVGMDQLRHVALDGDSLVLTGEEKIEAAGLTRFHKVQWRRG